MGEANRRKAADPNFGRIPKEQDYRGLIISCPMTIDGGRVNIETTAIDPQELRFALLFWEKLIWPSSRIINIASGRDEQFLESAGVLTRPEYSINGDGGRALAQAHYLAFKEREQKEPGVWAMAQGEKFLSVVEPMSKKGGGGLVQLHRAIPIPKEDVPLAEILEFRARRKDELWILRNHLEGFVAELETSEDRPERLQKQIDEIDRACADLIRVGVEWKFPVRLADMKAAFSLTASKAAPMFVGAMEYAKFSGLPETAALVAGIAGAAASTFEWKGDYARAIKTHPNPYRYAFQIHQELG